ncbi:fluoride efflux transporter CrcB [Roseovarius sp. C7]|uniref:fluoride efflux transporter CrcB n=1 Tax=Roseovarius sp. C7 TaxID=3398643 RepID=UPI0039F66485
MIMSFLQVALGGAIGASLRFGTGLALARFVPAPSFPVAILSVNVLGSFLMGLFVIFAFLRGHEDWNLFVLTGLLGGFTTFSAFSLEALTLFERGQLGSALLYVTLSVVLSLAAMALGVALARGLWA